ncbi:MAG: transposase [Candidatus Jordarchaeaceae archaeon]
MSAKGGEAESFKEHLQQLLRYAKRHGLKRIILIMDNATIHRSRETGQFLEKHAEKITPFYLPKYSPRLNEVEGRVNRHLKRDLCTNHNHRSIEDLEKATRKYMRKLNSHHKQSDLTIMEPKT